MLRCLWYLRIIHTDFFLRIFPDSNVSITDRFIFWDLDKRQQINSFPRNSMIQYYKVTLTIYTCWDNPFAFGCQCVCVSVCLGWNYWTASARNFTFLYVFFAMSRSSLTTKIIAHAQGQMSKYIFIHLFVCLFIFYIPWRLVYGQGQGQGYSMLQDEGLLWQLSIV